RRSACRFSWSPGNARSSARSSIPSGWWPRSKGPSRWWSTRNPATPWATCRRRTSDRSRRSWSRTGWRIAWPASRSRASTGSCARTARSTSGRIRTCPGSGRRAPVGASRDYIRVLEKAPDVGHRLAGEIEIAIGGVRCAEHEQVAARDKLVERQQFRVGGDERIGGQHGGGVAQQRLLELVAERGTGVGDVGLERHAEQPDGHARKVVAPAQIVADVQHQAFVDQHGGVAKAELVLRKGGKLHRVLHQTWAGGEARGGNPARARIIAAHRVVN